MLKEIIAILFSVAALTGSILWFVKEFIKKMFDADSERLKSKLILENQKYTKLQNEQFETLKLIYSNLMKTEELINEFYGIIKDDVKFSKQHKNRVVAPLTNLIFQTQRHFKENRIFIPKVLVPKIENVIDKLFLCHTKSALALIIKSDEHFDENGNYLGIVSKQFNEISNDRIEEFKEVLLLIEKTKDEELPKLIADTEIEFRKIFGSK
ncbi:hypothetical protein [Flavobacterium pallidum]|uniref:Uncharacterized protein n=1 Tax=Flavobacterium pallidum TaxID=2172098 RepID=A0A2S1SFG9_9FLAO|nr:hypothetical protein [Flavobacterium pallidum]AWI25156.1 hypothetical protein HYN49_04180 [Flavobacterium pallidum]